MRLVRQPHLQRPYHDEHQQRRMADAPRAELLDNPRISEVGGCNTAGHDRKHQREARSGAEMLADQLLG